MRPTLLAAGARSSTHHRAGIARIARNVERASKTGPLDDPLEPVQVVAVARLIALAIAGVATLAKPPGSPWLRSVMKITAARPQVY
jgi:hypothetical protein